MTQPSIATGLIGFGLAGSAFHAPLIAATPGLRLAGIASSQKPAVAAAWPDVPVFADPAALIADPSIELVVIATPNASHAPLARAALAAGRHVVIDKPFVADPEDGPALIAAAGAAGRVLSVFHNRRWDSDFRTVRSLVESGTLGAVMRCEMHWDRFRPAIKPGWREDPGMASGLLADLGPHLVDQALVLFGQPERVEADVIAQRPEARVDDAFTVTLHYGVRRVTLAASTLTLAPRPRFALHGTAGHFAIHGIDPQEAVLRAGGRIDDPAFGVQEAGLDGVLTLADGQRRTVPSERGDWRLYYAGMVAAIRDGAPPPVTPEDALAGLRLIDAARTSAREGRTIAL